MLTRRLSSPNSCIQLVNCWPDITLDDYINLKERVENRMVIADMTATGDDNVLLDGNAENSEVAYRKEQLRRLQDEVIGMEDVKTGVSITDLGLNDLRMDLLGYVKANGDLANVPNGMHSVVPSDPVRGLQRSTNHGPIFCCLSISAGVAQRLKWPLMGACIGHRPGEKTT